MMNISENEFGQINGEKVTAYTLENDQGMQLTCLNFGCIVTKILVPDKDRNFENVVLGFNTLEEYIDHPTYFGCIVGRVAGRIKDAQFTLDGKTYILEANEGNNHLHGGEGLHQKIWQAQPVEQENAIGMRFSYESPAGEAGYPGRLNLSVLYWLTNDNQWVMIIEGESDQKTIVNMTNHTYFNLSGHVRRDILAHRLTLKSDAFLELDTDLLPTGKKVNVFNTPFDFRMGRKLRDGVYSDHPQNILVGGYDHPFILHEQFNREIVLVDEQSGRQLTVETNQPCVIVYTANQLGNDFVLQEGRKGEKYLGVCLETQGYPDAVHHSHFPPIVLAPGEKYRAVTSYSFSILE